MEVARNYLKPFKKSGVDTLILGCTHYPLLKPVIQKVLGADVALIDSAKQAALEVKKILAAEGLLNKGRRGSPRRNGGEGRSRHRFFVSDNPEWFSGLAKRFLGNSPKNVRKVNV